MKKLLFSAALLFAAVLPSFSQRVAVLNGPSSIPCAYLMEENPEYDYEPFASAQLALPKLIKGNLHRKQGGGPLSWNLRKRKSFSHYKRQLIF